MGAHLLPNSDVCTVSIHKNSPVVVEKQDNAPCHESACRIVVLSDAIPDRNGVGTYYRDLMAYLGELSHHVEMIPAKANCYFRQSGISLRMPGDYTQRINFPNIIRIARRMGEIKPDVIVAPTLGPFGAFAYILSRRHHIRFIVGHHTAYDKLTQMYWKGLRAFVSRNCLQSLSRFLMRSADAVVATAEEMAQEAKQVGAKQVHCVGTSISKDFFHKEIRPFSGKIKTVLFAGRLASEKNIWALIEAAEVCPNQKFLIAGEGPERPALQKKAETLDNVKLLGWLTRKQLLEQIDAADMLILPSHIESFGTVALEGMARGRLVLVSQHCGILQWPELAQGLYSIQEDETLAGALKRIAGDVPHTLQAKAETAYQITRAVNDQTLTHWQTILQGADLAQN
ncbi:MAG: glycosyltransferase family 4 protein [candidate division KSB1 bacterium]|nr:glycosyltransferase family 4 protein [candidate division KSB1 bacterium]